MKKKIFTVLLSIILLSVMISTPVLPVEAMNVDAVVPPENSQPEATDIEEISPHYAVRKLIYPDGTVLLEEIYDGPPEPPHGYEQDDSNFPLLTGDSEGNIIQNFPAFGWVFGCSAVSGAMIAAYYDRNGYPNMYDGPTNDGVMPLTDTAWPTWSDASGDGRVFPNNPLIASHMGVDGRTTRGSIDNYWVSYGSTVQDPYITNGWPEHTWSTAIGDFMKTSQSKYGNKDSSTRLFTPNNNQKLTCTQMETTPAQGGGLVMDFDGTYGRKLFYEARGYTVTECYNQHTDNQYAGGFSFADFKAEIDAGRPVFFSVTGHSMVAYGYSGNNILIRDTWDNDPSKTTTMPWGGSYKGMEMRAVRIVHLKPADTPPPDPPDPPPPPDPPQPPTANLAFMPLIINASATGGSTGFNSQFIDGDSTGWISHSANWFVDIEKNHLFSRGIAGNSSSVSYTENFANFDYQVKMARYGNETNANRIFVRGTPTPLGAGNRWANGYAFQYHRSGSYSVFKYLNGQAQELQGWTSTSAINKGNGAWNILRVVANGPNLSFYINGTLVWTGSDTSFSSGRVGIGFFRSEGTTDQSQTLVVDWAVLTTLGTGGAGSLGETDFITPEQQTLNDTAKGGSHDEDQNMIP